MQSLRTVTELDGNREIDIKLRVVSGGNISLSDIIPAFSWWPLSVDTQNKTYGECDDANTGFKGLAGVFYSINKIQDNQCHCVLSYACINMR